MSRNLIKLKVKRFYDTYFGMIPLAISILLIIIVIITLILPKAIKKNRLLTGVRQLKENYVIATESIEAAADERIETFLKEKERLKYAIPLQDDFYNYLKEVNQYIHTIGLKNLQYTKGIEEEISTDEFISDTGINTLPGMEEMELLQLKAIPIKFQFQCSYRELYDFIHSIRHSSRYVQLDELSVKRHTETLQVVLHTRIYYLSPQSEATDGA